MKTLLKALALCCLVAVTGCQSSESDAPYTFLTSTNAEYGIPEFVGKNWAAADALMGSLTPRVFVRETSGGFRELDLAKEEPQPSDPIAFQYPGPTTTVRGRSDVLLVVDTHPEDHDFTMFSLRNVRWFRGQGKMMRREPRWRGAFYTWAWDARHMRVWLPEGRWWRRKMIQGHCPCYDEPMTRDTHVGVVVRAPKPGGFALDEDEATLRAGMSLRGGLKEVRPAPRRRMLVIPREPGDGRRESRERPTAVVVKPRRKLRFLVT